MSKTLSVIYCDDIRHEVGNKFSLMGCYSTIMYVATFPTILPKLSVHTTIKLPLGESFKRITVSMTNDGKEIATYDIEAAPNSATQDENQAVNEQTLIGGFTMASFELTGETTLEVSAVFDGEFVYGDKLEVKAAPIIKS